MALTGFDQAADHGAEKGTVTGGGFHGDHLGQSLVREVSGQIQHQLDHPGLGVDDTCFSGGWVGGFEGDHAII